MKINQLTKLFAGLLLALLLATKVSAQFNFSSSGLSGESLNNPTSLQFGPDGRLYVSQQNGNIYAYTIVRNGPNDYDVTATETIGLVKGIPNHDSDGSINTGQTNRQVTGIMVTGTAANPVLYATSSDPRIGGGGGATNTNLDENSGVISRLTWNGTAWDMVHLVRGLPRSEENHALNGLVLNSAGTVLYVCAGGHTNKGAPSNNFTFLPEFAYSTAILSVDLVAIDAMPTQTDAQGQQYKYDLPTLDDEDKSNVGSPSPGYEDIGDPWGGNGGKNQAMLVLNGPVQVYSSGWRNHYDVTITQAGRMYTFDNGPNSGWGGTPINCTNQVNESNSQTQPDNLHFVSGPGYYGGHPNPTRANRNNTFNASNPQTPIPIGMEDANCDYRNPGSQDGALATINSSTNGICEYTASNFNGGLQGNLLAAAFNGNIYRFELNAAGNLVTTQASLFSGFGATPLDVIAQGDLDPFPGTVWACTYGSNNITIFEPADFTVCSGTDTSFVADFDNDGYSNGDELLNGTDQCNASSLPEDWDQDFLSDLIDPDDDNDGINDTLDFFARDKENGAITTIPVSYQFDNSVDPGINGWGFTGTMVEYTNDYMDRYDDGRMTVGGAALKFTIDSVESGDALAALNNQRYAFQFGLNTSQVFLPFTIENRVMGPFATVTPANDMSQGVYIGTGDQDNYLKAVVHANGGSGGIEIVYEVSGTVISSTMHSVPAVIGAGSVELFFSINPTTRAVETSYSISQGAKTVLGSPINIPASWLSNVLAVGQIATSRNAPIGFAATWDYLTVTLDPNTSTGQWYDVTYNSPAPTNRHENSFVQVGDKFYLVGGRGNKPVQAFDIADSTWTTLATAPIEIHHFQAVNYKGMIWCVNAMTGGFPNETPIPDIYIYDPVSNTWHVGPTIPANRRRGSSGVVVYNDEIYLVSGIQNGHVSGWVNWVDKFNPETNTWTTLANAPRERDHWQAQLAGDKIYCMGGRRSGAQGTFGATVAEVDIYDIPSNTWTTLPAASNLPTLRAAGVVGLLGDEVILAGGESGTQSAAHDETEAHNINTDAWRSLSPMIDSRHGSSGIVNNGGLWVAAGSGNRGGSPELNTLEVFFFNGTRQPIGSPVAAGTFASAPASYDYGTVVLGNTVGNSFTLSNTSTTQGVLINSLTYTGDPDFSDNFPYTLPVVLPPGGSLSFNIDFTPGAVGARSGNLAIATNQSAGPLNIPLNGEGINLQPLYRVNCGGPAYTAVNSDAFSADAFFSGGSTSNTGNAIANTLDDVLYQSERWGAFTYDFPVSSSGMYEVRLHFAEIYSGAQSAGSRIFNLAIEGTNVLSNYDIFSDVGGYTAVIHTFQAPVTDGSLTITVSANVNNPKISAIEVFSAGSVPGSALASNPDPLHFFSQQTLTTSPPQNLSIVNTGTNSVDVTAITVSGTDAADFNFSFSLPVTIPGGDSIQVPFTFSPTTVGLKSASAVITHNGTNSPLSSGLTGEAIDLTFLATASVAQQPTCAGGSDGSATVSLNNGMAPFTYLWTPSGQTTATAIGLSEGSYTVRVIDMNNDTAFSSVVLVADSLFSNTTVCRDQGNNNLGQAVVTATGGATPYSFLWDAGAGSSTNDSVFGLANGSYSVTVTDGNNCTSVATVTVDGATATCDTCALPTGWANQDVGTFSPAGDVCYNSQTGEYTIDAAGTDIWGATDQFHYVYQSLTGDGEIVARVTSLINTNQWAKAGVMMRASLNANSQNAMFLKRGANGWSWQYRTTQGGNSGFSANTSTQILPLWVRIVRVGNSFTGYYSSDGTNWTQQGAAQTITMPTTIFVGLAVTSHSPGNLTTGVLDNVQVIGANGPPVSATASVTSNYNGEDVSCAGSTDGQATVVASDGVPPYSYQWDAAAASQTSAVAINLGAGTYSVTVTDNNNDIAVASVTLTEPTAVVASAVQTTGASAPGQADGSATASATGGILPYSFLWDAAAGSQTTATATNIADGTYSVTITDANGCTDVATVTVDTIPAFALRINAGGPQYVSVANDTFVADIHFVNGATFTKLEPIANTQDDVLYQTERYNANLQYAIPVPNGSYNVLLHFAEIFVGAPGGGSSLGAGARIFDVIVEGDTILRDLDLFDTYGTLTAHIEQVPSVIVTDGVLNINVPASVDNGKLSAIEVLNQAAVDPLTVSVSSPTFNCGYEISCAGSNDGSITATPSGGVAPYSYQWSANAGSATTPTVTNLGPGTYYVTVADLNLTAALDSIVLSEPAPVVASAIADQNESCAGANDGQATASAGGGCAPYAYLWDAAALSQTTATASGLTAGTYTVTITDNNGCTATVSVTIVSPPALNAAVVADNHVSCNGGSDGQASIAVTGGTSPYTYLWSNNATSATISGLTAGTYAVTATDANNCTVSGSVTITEPAAITATATADNNVSCNGGNDGQATVVATGGTSPYTYLWSNSDVTATTSGLTAGSYSVTVTDANNCTSTAAVSITEPAAISVSITPSLFNCGYNVSCNGASDGSATASASGGTAPYSYQWGTSFELRINAGGPGYTSVNNDVYVADQHFLTPSNTYTNNTIPDILNTNDDVLYRTERYHTNLAYAIPVPNGNYKVVLHFAEIYVGAQGGNVNLGVGDRIFSVDMEGQPFLSNYDLFAEVGAEFATQKVNQLTVTDDTLNIDFTALVDNAKISAIEILGIGGANATLSNLTAGTYDVLVTDANGCFVQQSVTLTEPAPLSPTISTNDALCGGQNTGDATVSVSGGCAPYTYLWDAATGNQTTATASNLGAGTYGVTVTDNNGCTVTGSATVNQPASLVLNATADNNVSCNGGSDGQATVTVSGGTSPYTYLWSNNATTATASGLAAGSYSVTVTDANNCSANASVTITEPAALTANTTVDNDVTCNGGSDGQASASASGGTSPYTYLWSNNATSATASGLAAGTHSVTITDANNCTTTASVTITEPVGMTASAVVDNNVSCNGGSDGQATATVTGGTSPYTYLWSNNATTATAAGLAAGTHSVTITDANNCSVSASVTISEPAAISASAVVDNHASCNGGNDGQATVSASGGTSPYTYLWSNNATTATASGLAGGTYTVTITDANNCTASASVTITEPAAITASAVADNNVSCNGGNDGQATVTAAGGTSPYTYLWSNNATTATASGLAAGTYTVTLTDANNCTATASVIINEPAALTAGLSSPVFNCGFNVSCNGASDGSISASPSGGTAPYTVLWPGQAIYRINANGPTYTATNGDVYAADGFFTQVSGGTFANNGATIAGTNDPTIYRTERYGNFSYDFPVTNGNYAVRLHFAEIFAPNSSVGDRIFDVAIEGNVALANYDIVADVGQFTAVTKTFSATVSDGTLNIVFTPQVDQAKISAIEVYSILPSNTLNNLTAGDYTIEVIDANGCEIEQTVTLTEPAVLTATASASTPVSCNGFSDGAATASSTGGCAPYTYLWDANAQNQTTATASGLAAGTYSVTITDANNCSTTASVSLTEPSVLSVTATVSTTISAPGASDGEATANASGGTSPYTYLWSNAQVGPVASNLAAGTYTVTVTDDNGCTATDTVTLVDPVVVIVLSTTTSDVSCNGGSDGSATVNATGGTLPYTYLWSNGATTATASGLTAGSYSVTVTDATPASSITTVTINEPTALTLTSQLSSYNCGYNVSCNGAADGSIGVTVSGGTMPYNYVWNTAPGIRINCGGPAYTSVAGTNFLADQYFQTPSTVYTNNNITDVLGTTDDDMYRTERWNANLAYSIPVTNGDYVVILHFAELYFGAPGGAAGGANKRVFDVNIEGQLAVDDLDMFATAGAATAIVRSFSTTVNDGVLNLNCTSSVNNAKLSAIEVIAVSAGSPNLNNLVAGNYTLTVVDANGCSLNNNFTLTEPDALALTATATDVNCNGGSDGSASVSVAGGCAPYTYLWSNSATTASVGNLAAGTVSVTVTDANNCTAATSVTIAEPAALTATAVADNNVSCNGGSDAQATVTASGGTPAYTYFWDLNASNQTTATATGLNAGTYSVTITDANNCTTTTSVTITEPTANQITATVDNHVTCNGGADGQATATISGAASPVSYLWSNGATTATASGLTAGTYSVTITDANTCAVSASVSITEPAAIVANASVVQHATCGGGNDGEATVSVSGGTAAYSYLWSNGATTATASGLIAGTYSVTVTDANNCTAIDSVTIVEPTTLTASYLVNSQPSCYAYTNGSATASAQGGVPPYSYLWSANAGSQTTATATNLGAGNYTVTVTDSFGCSVSIAVNVGQPGVLLLALQVDQDVNCYGGSNGRATALIFGGTSPYTYQWSASAGNQTGQTALGLPAGTHQVTVFDANGCNVTGSVNISQPAPVTHTVTINSNVSCNGGNDGSATVTPSGGTPGYFINWPQSAGYANTPTVNNLAAGTYSVLIRDAYFCFDTAIVVITEPAALVATTTVDNHVTCNGFADGQATASVSGGTAPYSYLWDANALNQTTATATGLAPGTYTVSITDNNNCTTTDSVTITEPAVLSASASGVDVSCNGAANGQATATATGGTTPYSYLWSNAATTASVSGLSGGTYSVTITDANNCATTASVAIAEPVAISLSISGTDPLCNGGNDGTATVSASGGASPFTYLWSNNATTASVSGLGAGTYTVTVTDANNCTATASVTLTEPAPMVATANVVNQPTCGIGNDGEASVSVSGGSSPYSYLWSNGGTTATISNLIGGTYTVTVTDANNCTASGSVTLVPAGVITLSMTGQDVSCFGAGDGQATVTPSGGVPPYTFVWSNSASTQTVSNLNAGTYSVTVTDVNNCNANASVTISEPTAIVLSTTASDPTCNAGTDGSASVAASGGNSPYTYLWSNSATAASISGLGAGTYAVTVTDAGNCSISTSVTLTDPAAMVLTGNDVSCPGAGDGSVIASGGTAPYTYVMSNQNFSLTNAISFGIDDAEEDQAGVVRRGRNNLRVAFANNNLGNQVIGLRYRGLNIPQGATIVSASVQFTSENTNNVNPSALVIAGEDADNSSNFLNSNFDLSTRPSTTANANWSPADWTTVGAAGPDQQTPDLSAIVQEIVNRPGWSSGNNLSLLITGQGRRQAWSFNGSAADAPELTVVWYVGTPPTSNTNLSGGTYDVTVTDANGCIVTQTITIAEPAPMSLSLTSNDPSCNGAADGDASVTVSGGNAPYTYAWSNNATTASISGLSGGTYSVVVTDANNCTVTGSVTLTEPAALTLSSADVSCNGDADGSVSASGGTGPYTYSITPLGTLSVDYRIELGRDDAEERINGTVNRGNNDLELVFDGNTNGNQKVGVLYRNVGIPQGATITNAWIQFTAKNTANINPSNLTIEGNDVNNAALITTTTNDITNRARTTASVSWSPPNWTTAFAAGADERTPDISNIVQEIVNRAGWNAGNRMMLIIEGQGRRRAMSFNGDSAQAPILHVEWTQSASASNTNLAPGSYNVTVTDANGCIATQTLTIAEPPVLLANAVVDQHATCNGGGDGQATASASGGTSPYSFAWSNSQTSATATNLNPGTYTVTVTDANGCTATSAVTINQSNPNFAYTVTDVSCNGGNDGCIVVNGGVPPYSYTLNGQPLSAQTGLTFSRVNASSDDVEETVSGGAINLNSTSLELAEDNFAGSGDLQLIGLRFNNLNIPPGATITGATLRFTALTSDSDPTNLVIAAQAADNAGTFSSTNGDVSSRNLTTASVNWNNVPAWNANTTYAAPDVATIVEEIVNRPGWNSGNSMVMVVSGATGHRQAKSWDENTFQAPMLTVTYSLSPTLCNLTAGSYNLVVTDSSGCTDTQTHVISEPPALALSGVDATCPGVPDGSISASGGTAPYSYQLSGPGTGSVDVRVSSGNDDAEETVNGGAMNTNSGSLEMAEDNFANSGDPQLVGLRFQNLGIPQGATITNARIEFTAGPTTTDPTNLVFVGEDTDNAAAFSGSNSNISNRTTTSASVNWNNVPAFNANQTYTSPSLISLVQEVVNRAGWSSGNAMAFVVSGSGHRDAKSFENNAAEAPRLIVEYSNAQIGQSVTNLVSGGYLVTVTDGNGCTLTDSVILGYSGTNCNPCVNGRVQTGLLALYPFSEISGTVVHDLGGFGTPLDLTIADPANTNWLGGNGISINSSTIIAASTPATKIATACGASNEITVEAWVKPANTSQSGPTRMVTYSVDPYNRNWTLGQEGSTYIGRLRTSTSAVNGTPDLPTPSNTVSATNMQHVVMTRDASGSWIIYVDGVVEASGTRTGNLNNWDPNYPFALANEATLNRAWLGEMYLVAVYERALTPGEVNQNLQVGPDCSANFPPFAFCSGAAELCANPFEAAFDGSQSFDVDGSIASYNWNFGDGNTGSGATAVHTYNAAGTYTATLVVTDNDGAMDTCQTTVTVSGQITGRVDTGLIALYPFIETSGGVVHDASGYLTPLDLTISNPNNVSWLTGTALSVNSGVVIKSGAPATKIHDACQTTDEITVEAWVKPANTTQGGPTRIASMSQDPYNRNFTLGQEGDDYIGRVRTSTTNANGMPDINGNNNAVTTNLQHVVMTRNAAGQWRLYVDGTQVMQAPRGGDFSNWDDTFQFMLANELTEDRDWLGELHLVAVYNIALSPSQIGQNLQAGPDCNSLLSPFAVFKSNTDACGGNLTVYFDGSLSSDADGTITSYAWNFGDGNTSSAVAPTHTYASAGTYTVSLTVTDNDNLTTTSTETVTVTTTGRVSTDLIAYYPFNDGSGNTVTDQSGFGTPLDLTVANPGNVAWIPGNGMSIASATVIQSSGAASKITQACQQTNAITVEAWVAPKNATQGGPARIATLSVDANGRNFTLGQEGNSYRGRLRTTSTGNNGTPDITSGNAVSLNGAQHVVMTRDASGNYILYVNGTAVSTSTRTGNFNNWSNYAFALVNELSQNRAWLGDIFQVAVYREALTANEVGQNFAAGANCVPATSSKLAGGNEPLGNNLAEAPLVEAYPNPFREAFTLHFESKEVYGQLQVTISDQYGKEVLRRNYLTDDGRYLDKEISLNNVTAGVYVVTVTSGDFSKRIRLVKQ